MTLEKIDVAAEPPFYQQLQLDLVKQVEFPVRLDLEGQINIGILMHIAPGEGTKKIQGGYARTSEFGLHCFEAVNGRLRIHIHTH